MVNSRAAYGRMAAPHRAEALTGQRWDLFPYLLVVMVLLTLVSLFHVWSRVKVVDLTLQVSEARRMTKEAQQENNQLRLEVASQKAPARIEALAKGQLGMALPSDRQVVVVR